MSNRRGSRGRAGFGNFDKGPDRSHGAHGASLDTFAQARTLEEACRSVNRINDRTKRETRDAQERQREDYARRKVTLSSAYDEWLKKEIP